MQTIVCRECKELYDAVTRLRVLVNPDGKAESPRLGNTWVAGKRAPTFQVALNRLAVYGGQPVKWIQFPLQCPVMPFHRIQVWNDPDRCPRCGVYLERNVLPFRIWD